MASPNLELVGSIYAAWERGDYSEDEWADPEIEFVFHGMPNRTGRGREGMAEAWREFLNSWEDFRQQAGEYHELDDERVLVLANFGGRGKTSGVEVAQMRKRGATLFHVRDGKVTRFVGWIDSKEAVAELGITLPTDPQGS